MHGWLAAGLVTAALAAAPGAAQAQATFPVTMVTARESDPEVRVPVDLSPPGAETVRVNWSAGPPFMIADVASALEGRDYANGKGTLEFAPGDTREEIVLALLDDDVYEGGVMLALTLGAGGPSGPFAIVEIRDDEDPPEVSIADVTVPESAGVATLRLVRPWPSTATERYGWSTVAGTASIGADFVARTGEVGLSSLALAGSKDLEIPVEDDALDEPDETFEVRLVTLPPPSPWGGATGRIADGVATVTIADDDPQGAAPALTARGVRGRVLVRPPGGRRQRLSGDLVLRRGTLVDARRGAVGLRLGDREATLAGGIVKVRGLERLALAGGSRRGCARTPRRVVRRLAVAADPGLVVAGRRAATSAVGSRARWVLADRCRATRVTVRSGRVSALARGRRADELPAGARRSYR